MYILESCIENIIFLLISGNVYGDCNGDGDGIGEEI